MDKISKAKENKKCQNCGNTFTSWKCSNRKYCSKKCSNRANAEIKKSHIFKRLIDQLEIISHEECWEFIGTRDNHGYGKLSNRFGRKGSPEKAHRIMCEFIHGDLAESELVLHKCDNPACCNPNHLEKGDQKKNMSDASKRGRLNPKSLLNLRPGKSGYRSAAPAVNNNPKTKETYVELK